MMVDGVPQTETVHILVKLFHKIYGSLFNRFKHQ